MATDTSAPPRPVRSPSGCCDDGCESGVKNNFFEGKRVTPEMFRIEQKYAIDRRRLLNRAVHGWGVVYGYAISVEQAKTPKGEPLLRRLKIGAGLALDQCGRELVRTGGRPLTLADAILIDDEFRRLDDPGKAYTDADTGISRTKDGDSKRKVCWLLSVNYAEQPMGHVNVKDPCRCDHDEWDHICETVRYTLRRIDCRECCDPFPCELTCTCTTGPCCDDHAVDHGRGTGDEPGKTADPGKIEEQAQALRNPKLTGEIRERPNMEGLVEVEALPPHNIAGPRPNEPEPRPTDPDPARRHEHHPRGGCRCLCDHITERTPGEGCSDRLCEIEEPCGPVRVDLRHGVPLACVEIDRDGCGDWTFGDDLDVCGPRRLVKHNDLLFDLIRGCDVTFIDAIGWAPWHRAETPVSFTAFSEAFGPELEDQPAYVTRKFWVRFSRPVKRSTLRPDVFAVTILNEEEEGGWWQPMRVPIIRIDTTLVAAEPGDPPDHVRSARVVVDGGWCEDGLRGRRCIFQDGETRVEIEVRGDLIVDCNGQTVDANNRGLHPAPTGNGSPGGTFFSSFRVDRSEPISRVKGASS